METLEAQEGADVSVVGDEEETRNFNQGTLSLRAAGVFPMLLCFTITNLLVDLHPHARAV